MGPIVHLKKFYRPKSLGTFWDEEICEKNFFTLLSFRDTAVCLHFWAKYKMAARGPERVTSQVF